MIEEEYILRDTVCGLALNGSPLFNRKAAEQYADPQKKYLAVLFQDMQYVKMDLRGYRTIYFFSSIDERTVKSIHKIIKKTGKPRLDCLCLDIAGIGKYKTDFASKLDSACKFLQLCKESGITKNIGLANCDETVLDTVRQKHNIVPNLCLQDVSLNHTQGSFLDICRKEGIPVCSFTMYSTKMHNTAYVHFLGKKYKTVPYEILSRWLSEKKLQSLVHTELLEAECCEKAMEDIDIDDLEDLRAGAEKISAEDWERLEALDDPFFYEVF